MHCSLHCLGTHIGNLLSLELPLNCSTSRGVVSPSSFSLQPAPHAPKASSAAQHAGHRQLSQSLWISISSVHELFVEASLATNLSCCQAFFVPRNHCPSFLCWSPWHAFCSKKFEKPSTYKKNKVLTVLCVVWCIFSPFTKNSEDPRRL